MYSKSKFKQAAVTAGVTSSFLYEINSNKLTFNEWRKELKSSDFCKAYDLVNDTVYHESLMSCNSLATVRITLLSLNLEAEYHLAKEFLNKHGVGTCGYGSAGRLLTIHNSVSQLTIDTSKPTGPQLDYFLAKWVD